MTEPQRLLITGGNGFVGKYLKDFLQTRYQVFAPKHQELELTNGPEVQRYLNDHDIDIVVHCAYQKHEGSFQTSEAVENNLRIFFNLAQNITRLKKIIHFGSGAEYDKTRPIVKIKEQQFGERIPQDHYGFCKYVISQIIERSEKMICLRLCGIYGPGENYLFTFISNAIVKNLFGQVIKISQNVQFSYLYADDLAPIVDHFISHDTRYKSYNIVPDYTVQLTQIAKTICDIAAKKSDILILNPGLNREYTADNIRLKEEFPEVRFTDLKTAISKLYEYYRVNLELLDKAAVLEDKYLSQASQQKPMASKSSN